MAPRILDEHGLLAREQQIIDAAIELIEDAGIENFTMDKVIAKVPFSKGTVYKHFIGKEDLFLAMNNLASLIVSDFFSRAKEFKGCTREKLLLLNFSYLIYAILHPVLFKAMLCSKTSNVYGKSSESRIKQQRQNETKLLSSVYAIIDEAIAQEQLTLPHNMDIQQVCFANWSMAFGSISLLSDEVDECSGRTNLRVEQELINQSNLLFDGLQWNPLAKEKDYSIRLKSVIQQIFPEELVLMKAKGRELHF